MRFIATALEAEENAAAQMRALGYLDAQVTDAGPDGGIDVASERAIAQVKWRGAAVGRPDLQNLVGARGNDHHLDLLFFAASAYTEAARAYAEAMAIALFTYDPAGELTPVGDAAEVLVLRAQVGLGAGTDGAGAGDDALDRYALLEARAWLTARLRGAAPARRRSERPGWWRRNWALVVAIVLAVGAVGSATEAGVPVGERITSLFGGLLFAAAFGLVYYRRRARRASPAIAQDPAVDSDVDVAQLRREVRSLTAETFDESWTSFAMYCRQRTEQAKRSKSGRTLALRINAEVGRIEDLVKRSNGRMTLGQVKAFVAEVDDARARLERLR